MNLANPETKVGLFSITALLALFFLFLWLNGTQIFQRGTEIEAVFDRIEGLRPGATVQFAGVDIGRVSKIYFDGVRVVAAMRIQPNVKIPQPAKVIISSSGVIGDKFLEIVPANPGEVLPKGKRLMGQNPVTMDDFYTTAYSILESLKTVSDSIKYFVTDPEIGSSLKNTLIRFDQISADFNNITDQLQNVRLNEMVTNITKISAQLAEASSTANRFLKDMDNKGQTATDLKQIIANANKISANLEKLTTLIANKDQDIIVLINDAHETMQSIKAAADNANKAINQLTTGNGTLTQVRETIDQTSQAAEKINNYVIAIEKISLKNSIGARYQNESQLMMDYKLDTSFNERNSLLLGLNDIGQTNLASLQWAFKHPKLTSRLGLYRNKFGVGLDIAATSRLSLGIDLWDTTDPNIDLISNWKFSPHWSMSLGGDSNINSQTKTWNFEWWHQF